MLHSCEYCNVLVCVLQQNVSLLEQIFLPPGGSSIGNALLVGANLSQP